ncbi:IQ and AAA domain-containing protein 1-like [Trichogramma pretiosum]|uniref:IQ and AAA domain-containing protein 1-like n=1 Tax=Trichogramma pretiosum TaxID=7493 RepID=UPI0006C99EEB|nr:IQ and AAA domain-containing protein 1-like [Trichogramma pretiosum]
MSNAYYVEQWFQVRRDLEQLMQLDERAQKAEPILERKLAMDKVAELYYRYRKLVQRQQVCHDEIHQPQLRQFVGELMDRAILRMLELRQEMQDLSYLDCPWPVETLRRLKMCPADVELSGPLYDWHERRAEIERRRKLIESTETKKKKKKQGAEQKRLQLERLLGMTLADRGEEPRPRSCIESWRDFEAALAERHAKAGEAMRRLVEKETERMYEVRGPELVEDIQEEIRVWMWDWYKELELFDSIPDEKYGGTVRLATGEARTPADMKATPDKAPPPDEGSDQQGQAEPEGWTMRESKIYPLLQQTQRDYYDRWEAKSQELLDPGAKLLLDYLREDIGQKLQLDMRKIADERMRPELAQLKDALMTDKAEQGGEIAFPPPQEFPIQPPPPNNPNVPLAEVPSDELYVELVRAKVLSHEAPTGARLRDWPGQASLAHDALDSGRVRLGDVVQPIVDYCVLPIASRLVGQLAPQPCRAVCICGGPDCGQTFLAHAVCNELRATVFDLSPERHRSRFKSRKSQQRLTEAVTRLARECAPSVILVETEMAWLKKIPAELRRFQPKRFAPIYKKLVSSIRAGDQVLFLTTSFEPNKASRQFVKLHDKFIWIPLADYGSLYLECKRLLMRHPRVDRHERLAGPVRVAADRLGLAAAQRTCQRLTGLRRSMEMRKRPFGPGELLEEMLAERPRLGQKELDKLNKWKADWPQEKKRKQVEKDELAEEQAKKEAAEKQQNKKKK